MNQIYRSVWNATLGTWVAAAENVRARGKGTSAVQAGPVGFQHILESGIRSRIGVTPIVAAMMLLFAQGSRAQTLYWDINGAASGIGGTGTWNTTNPFWNTSSTGTGGTLSGWNNAALNDANFSSGGTYTVTLDPLDPITAHNINNVAALGGGNSVLARIGGRLVHKWAPSEGSTTPANTAWMRANVWHEFSGQSNVSYQTAAGPVAFGAKLGGTWGELEIGVSASLTPSTSIDGTIGYQHSLGGTQREGSSLNASVNTGGMATAGAGLSMQLTPNARLTTKVAYANGPKGSVGRGASANVGLDVKW